jgi:hypothetical protein
MRASVIATVAALGASAWTRYRRWSWLVVLLIFLAVWLIVFVYGEVWGVKGT